MMKSAGPLRTSRHPRENAGIFRLASVTTTSLDDYEQIMAVHPQSNSDGEGKPTRSKWLTSYFTSLRMQVAARTGPEFVVDGGMTI